MSSLSGRTSRTRSQASYRASSQEGMGAALEDTTSSTLVQFRAKGSSTVISPSVASNSAYAPRRAQIRARSASPVPCRIMSQLDVSVAQRRAQLATQTAESAMSGVGRVAEETRHACSIAEAAIAEMVATSSRMEQKVASVAAQAEKTAV